MNLRRAELCACRPLSHVVWAGHMRNYRHVFIGAALAGLTAQPAIAGSLTRGEQTVCQSLLMCMDIVTRHDATEFDYAVLTEEFRRFGPKGRAALLDGLNGAKATPDMAILLAETGPPSAEEFEVIDKMWAGPKAALVTPLLQDITLANRNRWVAGLSHPDESVRVFSRRLYRMDDALMAAPFSAEQISIILKDMSGSPSGLNAALLSKLPAAGHEAEFEALLLKGFNFAVLNSAYEGLYRNNPSKAFQALMIAMRSAETPQQIGNLGGLIAYRHQNRPDGFYGKFAVELSGDPKAPPQARAVALDAWFKVMAEKQTSRSALAPLPEMTPQRREALNVLLIKGAADVDSYARVLDEINSPIIQPAIDQIWRYAERQNLVSRVSILNAALDTPLEDLALQDALTSRDKSLLLAGMKVAQTKPQFLTSIQRLEDHPLVAVAVAARLAQQGRFKGEGGGGAFFDAKQSAFQAAARCRLNAFDIQDLVNQMPFFDAAPVNTTDAWVKRVTRKKLNAAHPTKSGWLAAYYQGAQNGALVYFDNQTGEGKRVGNFRSPFAILPDRPLRLGERTDTFWIVDSAGHMGDRQDLYQLKITGDNFDVRRVVELPDDPRAVSLTNNGDILVSFDFDERRDVQPPLRITSDGQIFLACRSGN